MAFDFCFVAASCVSAFPKVPEVMAACTELDQVPSAAVVAASQSRRGLLIPSWLLWPALPVLFMYFVWLEEAGLMRIGMACAPCADLGYEGRMRLFAASVSSEKFALFRCNGRSGEGLFYRWVLWGRGTRKPL